MASSSSSSPPKYDVFLSFRGEDTRDKFTSHLYAELERKKINAFIDYKLERGDEISPELYKAIEESEIYVIIFSKDYASSRWCLDELVKILDCREIYQRHVIPVFYEVDPSIVRHQKESYADAFVKHEKRFAEEVTRRWKVALTKSADLSGWDSNTTRPESSLVDGIVEDILKKRSLSLSSDHTQGRMVAIEENIAQIQSLLQLESEAVRIIGIWGMGGIGKTTLAQALHRQLTTQFRYRSCIINAQQEIDRDGIYSLRKKYLSELLEEGISSNGLHYAIERVTRAKVLLILDDLKNPSQLQELIGGHGNFGPGSRIIVTSRDKQVLNNAEADEIYEVKKMNPQDSLQLFNLNAFKRNSPTKVNMDLVEKVLKYAKGVPLALKVLGSLLCGKEEKVWKGQLDKLEKLPNDDIFNVLKLSYDGLDEEQKDIFLDIVCFFEINVAYVDHIVDLLDGCGFSADSGIDVLKDRGLISIEYHRIDMHDLIVEMGKEIIRRECVSDPGKRSRLWNREEIYHVLRKNKGTDEIQCIMLSMNYIEEVQQQHLKNVKSMDSLRMLYLDHYSCLEEGQSNLILPALLESLPDGLKVLYWEDCPLRSLPLGFCPENLVKLYMPYSKLQKLWEDNQEIPNLSNLRKLDLSDCESLETIPCSIFKLKLTELNLNGCSELKTFPEILEPAQSFACIKLDRTAIQELPSSLHHLVGLEELSLEGCGRLEIIPSSIGRLTKLRKLDLRFCESLETFPSSVFQLKLRKLDFQGCSKLKTFPEILERAESFSCIKLDRTAIQELPSSLHHLVGLEQLSLRDCRRLEIIPSSIGRLNKLRKLDLSGCELLETFPSSVFQLKLTELDFQGCSKLKTFPEILETAESFACIKLNKTAIQGLPSSLHNLVGLEELSMRCCRRLEIIPSSIGRLNKLRKLNLIGCESLETFPGSIFQLKLTELDFQGCSKLKTFPEILEPAESFACIKLDRTAIQGLPSSLHNLVNLEELSMRCCRWLEIIPSSIGRLTKLCKLYLSDCNSLKTFPSSIFKLKLTELDFQGCSELKTFPEILEPAESFACIKLDRTAIQGLPSSLHHLVNLEELSLRCCRRLKIISSSIGRLTKLCKLDFSFCESLETFPSSVFQLKLTELDFYGCSKLKTFPEILEPAESFACIKLDRTAIQELPSSLHHLVGLEELSLRDCRRLEIIPSSIGRLTKLCKLYLSDCDSLETFPSNIFELKLTELDFQGCSKLKTFPEILEPAESFACIKLDRTAIQGLPSSLHNLVGLEELSMRCCRRLEIIPSSIERLTKLCNLYLSDCDSLETFPSSIFELKLTKLDFQGCSKLKTFPEILEPAESFACIRLDETAIQELPSSLHHLVGLEELSLRDCRRLEIIPSSIGRLTKLCKLYLSDCDSLETFPSNIFELKLTELDFQGCSKLKTFPEILEPAESFACIRLDETAIQELPSSLHHLVGLEELSLRDCRRLEIIPSSIGRLTKLCKLYLSDCDSLETFPSSIFELKLTELDFQGCSKLKTFPEILEPAESFACIKLDGTPIQGLPSSLHNLVNLEELSLRYCRRLEIIPSSIGRLTKLCKLDLNGCKLLETFPSSVFQLMLRKLDLNGCSELKTFPQILKPAKSFACIKLDRTAIQGLPSSLHHLVNLEELSLRYCRRLEIIPSSIGRLTKLRKLDLIGCESLETFPSSIFQLKLNELDFQGCSKLKTFPEILERAESFSCIKLDRTAIQELPSSLHHLVGLEQLSLRDCRRLEIIPSSIGRLNKLRKLDLSGCELLETFPSSVFQLKLTELDFQGCSKLKTFPEILETAESFACIKLDKTAIQGLPSSLHNLVGLEELSIRCCRRLEIIPSSIGRLNKLRKLNLIGCESLETFPGSIFQLKLTELDFQGCSKLKTFPEILEPAESFACIKLDRTAIQGLPSSLHNLVNLEELSMRCCRWLEIIPSSIGRLTKLCKLYLSDCNSLKTFPSSIFKLKLTELDFQGCSELKTFPEILEPSNGIGLPSAMDSLVDLQSLSLSDSDDLESLPNGIGNLNHLTELDCACCEKLIEIPNDIGLLSSLRKLSLQYTAIMFLPKSIAHFSNLESLDVSRCRNLTYIPQLPPSLIQLLAFDCPMLNSKFELPSNSKEGGTFKLYFSKGYKQEGPSAPSDIVADARLKITRDPYRFLFYYCFPGSAVPDWFPYRRNASSIIINTDSLSRCNEDGIVGFAMCVVWRHVDGPLPTCRFDQSFKCRLTFEYDDRKHIIPNDRELENSFSQCGNAFREGYHTFLWKYYFMDSARIDKGVFHAQKFIFEVLDINFKPRSGVKECGIFPLYAKGDEDGSRP